jgi:hypothetical protein
MTAGMTTQKLESSRVSLPRAALGALAAAPMSRQRQTNTGGVSFLDARRGSGAVPQWSRIA